MCITLQEQRNVCCSYLKKIITTQDFQQRINMLISVSLELYRVMVSSLLIIFVPQKCGDHICSIMENENLYYNDKQYSIGLIINYITCSIFLIMYMFEIRRESKLIHVLEVNNTISTDNESVGKRLDILPPEKRKQLFDIDRHYQYASYSAMIMYVFNIILSGIVINKYSLGNQTMLNFLTNILFMVSKMSNVYIIINTDKNIFFSAYLNTKVQFNDIDPHEMKKIEKRRSIEKYTAEIAKSGGRNLMDKRRIELIDGGGFTFIESSDSDVENV